MATISKVMKLDFVVAPQVLRRSFNTICVTSGVNEIVLRAMMGHASPEMTELYAGVPLEDKQRVLKAVVGQLFEWDLRSILRSKKRRWAAI